ncbi:hypothetical protein ACS0TY_011186 [Phlomoides rotata]
MCDENANPHPTGSYTGAAKDKALRTAEATKKKAGHMVESGKETSQAGKEKTWGILQQTGEQVKGMATDAVKRTVGMAEEEENKNKGY